MGTEESQATLDILPYVSLSFATVGCFIMISSHHTEPSGASSDPGLFCRIGLQGAGFVVNFEGAVTTLLRHRDEYFLQ